MINVPSSMSLEEVDSSVLFSWLWLVYLGSLESQSNMRASKSILGFFVEADQ